MKANGMMKTVTNFVQASMASQELCHCACTPVAGNQKKDKMKVKRIKDPSGNGFYTIAEGVDFEFENPLEKIRELYVTTNVIFDENILLLKSEKDEDLRKLMQNRKMAIYALYEKAFKEWEIKKKEYLSIEVPPALFKVLKSNSKKEQIQALKGLTVTNSELTAFICQAGENLGYKYSQYKSHHYPNGLEEDKLPEMFYTDGTGGDVKVIGETSLSDGQLKQAIDHRKVIVAKFLDNQDSWHCFFLTYKSLRGEERWEHPHLHYISNTWEIERSEVVKQLSDKNYSLPSLPHINYHTHRNPKDDKKEK
ncbi:MAG: hypothetical protein H6563_01100 [Lewinellaceae bacterium]|nr:hypothetical protein [Lewinellaceae bacterium]